MTFLLTILAIGAVLACLMPPIDWAAAERLQREHRPHTGGAW